MHNGQDIEGVMSGTMRRDRHEMQLAVPVFLESIQDSDHTSNYNTLRLIT